MLFEQGQRVQHATDGSVGTVHLFPDAEPGTASGEVRWDGDGQFQFADQLELVADQLVPLANE